MDRILLKTSTQSQRDSNLNKHAITQQVGLVLAADALLATDTRIENGKLLVRIDCRNDTSTTRLSGCSLHCPAGVSRFSFAAQSSI